MKGKKLRHGYSTGACAAAATKAAVAALFGETPAEVFLDLPWNSPEASPVCFSPVNRSSGGGRFSCGIIKDGGDDHPDVTHGMEIRAEAGYYSGEEPLAVEILGGEGVGRVTRPGLAAKVGGYAINPVPRAMIEEAVRASAKAAGVGKGSIRVVISAPEGGERAKKTMNAQLGIIGGISILGSTGIVIPMSAAAWKATIDACLDVAKASGAARAILAFGRTSENAAKKLYPELSENAAVIMGDHIGYSIDSAIARGLSPVIAGQFAKFVKVAGGHYATHVKDSSLDLGVVKRLMEKAGFGPEEAEGALGSNTARQVFEELRQKGDRGVFSLLASEVAEAAAKRAGSAALVEAALFDYSGECLATAEVAGKRR